MRGKSPMKIAAGVAVAALFAAGCSSNSGSGNNTPSDTGGDLRIYSAEPASLMPPAANDQPSIYVIRQLYKGLVDYDANGKPVNMVADSITSSDNKVWTIKLKPGWKFTNGEAITADTFINSWNYTALGKNAQNNEYFFEALGIQGVADMQGDNPKATTLSGLKKIDDLTFQVTLDNPFVGLPAVVGYSGFFPVPQACLDAPDTCNDTPIGDGPYKIDGSWQHNVQIKLVRNDAYNGPDKGKPDTLTYKIYDADTAAYADFEAGEIDVMPSIPSDKYQDAKAKYGDALYERPGDSFQYLGFPLYLPEFQNVKLRQALSLDIDRKNIINALFDGRFTPASGFTSPNYDGNQAGKCEFCKYDPEKAKQLLAEAGGWPAGKKIVLWANAGASHEKWLQAVGNGWKKDLGIDFELKVDLQFAEYLDVADGHKFTGPFRLGWGPDYPVLQTYLEPLYGTGASSNDSGYSNPEFDNLVKQGNQAATLADGIKSYQQAEDILMQDLPVIPMWFGRVTALHSDNVSKFVWSPINGPEFGQMVIKK